MDASVSDRMWIPDTYIVNAKTSFIHDVTTRNGLLILYPNGTVIYVLRITSRVRATLILHSLAKDYHLEAIFPLSCFQKYQKN